MLHPRLHPQTWALTQGSPDIDKGELFIGEIAPSGGRSQGRGDFLNCHESFLKLRLLQFLVLSPHTD